MVATKPINLLCSHPKNLIKTEQQQKKKLIKSKSIILIYLFIELLLMNIKLTFQIWLKNLYKFIFKIKD